MNTEFKRITSITKIQKKSKVVNFSVNKNENYLANGILTHNCYMKRHLPEGLTVAKNYGDILTAINNHAYFYADVKKPNQTDPEYVTYDIACNEDFALHAKYHEWQKIFEFFVEHPIAKATFATKIIPTKFLEFNPKKKVRIRFSLMPQIIKEQLEPNTPDIIDRIKSVNKFIEAGYEVHLNFSPVVVFDNWLKHYAKLFALCDAYIKEEYKKDVLSEVIFLTHNENKHNYNVANNVSGEDLLWQPKKQEVKTSQYGGKNIRYAKGLKSKYIKYFTSLHDEMIPWNKIRYIF